MVSLRDMRAQSSTSRTYQRCHAMDWVASDMVPNAKTSSLRWGRLSQKVDNGTQCIQWCQRPHATAGVPAQRANSCCFQRQDEQHVSPPRRMQKLCWILTRHCWCCQRHGTALFRLIELCGQTERGRKDAHSRLHHLCKLCQTGDLTCSMGLQMGSKFEDVSLHIREPLVSWSLYKLRRCLSSVWSRCKETTSIC